MTKLIGTLFFLTISLLVSNANSAVRYVFDFDGTLVNDHGENAAWRTDWILVRVDQRHSALQANPSSPIKLKANGPSGPDEFAVLHPPRLYVSYAEYKMMQSRLAKDSSDFGSLNPEDPVRISPHPKFQNQPIWILPGLYRVDPSVTYERFQMIGENYSPTPLMEDAVFADRREQQSKNTELPLKVEGPAFGIFRRIVNQPENKNQISFNTARGFSRNQLDELFSYWVKTGRLSKHPNKSNYTLHSAGDPSLFDRYDRGNLSAKKVKAIELEAWQLLKAPFKKHFEIAPRLDPNDPQKSLLMNTLFYAEDDPTHATNVGKLMASLSNRSEFKFDVKMVLMQVDAKNRSLRYPHEYTVFYDGQFREALPEEIALWSGISCNSHLSQNNWPDHTQEQQ